jgi:hypothetical protein
MNGSRHRRGDGDIAHLTIGVTPAQDHQLVSHGSGTEVAEPTLLNQGGHLFAGPPGLVSPSAETDFR